MHWFRSQKDHEPTRDKNVKELCASFPSIRRPQDDDNMFELLFEIDRKYNTLRIYLPSDFPANKPGSAFVNLIFRVSQCRLSSVLQILGPVVHPWLDQYKRVSGCDKVWTRR